MKAAPALVFGFFIWNSSFFKRRLLAFLKKKIETARTACRRAYALQVSLGSRPLNSQIE